MGLKQPDVFLIKKLDLSVETVSHPAELSDAGVGGLSQSLGFNRRLAEEEKHLVIIRVFTLRDPKGTDKLWFWGTETKRNNVSFSNKL